MSSEGLDLNLRRFATDRQWEYMEAVEKHGSGRLAAETLGVNPSALNRAIAAVRAKAAQHGYSPDHDMRHPVPDGFKVGRITTLRDLQTGEAKIQWQIAEPDRERQLEMMRQAIEAFASDLPRLAPIAAPQRTADALASLYPIGDHHIGMLSWEDETGDNYDLAISERRLMGAINYLVDSVPASGLGIVAFMGDFMHTDGMAAVTPTSGHLLDADSRFPKIVRAAIRSMRYLIDRAAERHAKVHVIVEIGNHDLSSSIFLMECLANIYENDPRITVDTSPRHYHYIRFGRVLVGTHHGHGSKMQDLPLIMATDRPEDWGASNYRYWFTGHVHHDQVKDYNGCRVESVRILAPTDAYASQKGYRSMQDMKAIVLHRDHGEVARNIVNPGMIEG